ncbi:hypothetical protein ACK8HY_13820 [Sphingobacterium sp. NGMCC 1.201703]|uniref:hypothetical protein n=1 Tax=Sphingobacterium sp. NGMCC 1.201703 TaxID=3388657 RepID=UPI0039FD1324
MRYIYLFIIFTFLLGCGKDGPIGPTGERGEGGINGTNGSTILSGKVPPSTTIGLNGDFYLDLSTGNLYGPKTINGWGSPFNLKGPSGTPGSPGSPGTPGSSILSGRIVPSITTGKEGDFYINLNDMTIFGPKTNDGWGNPVSLKPDKDLGIDVYLIDRIDFSGNASPINSWLYHFKGSSETYEIPFVKGENYLEFSYTIPDSRFDNTLPIFTERNWQKLPLQFTFCCLVVSLDYYIETATVNFRTKNVEDEPNKYRFYFDVDAEASFRDFFIPGFTIMVRNYKMNKKKASNLSSREKRYLRLK